MFRDVVFWSGLSLVVFTGLYNVGIIAIDDYNHGFSIMVPAQSTSFSVRDAFVGIHPALPKCILYGVSRLFWKLGIDHPVWQLRLSLALLGVLCFLILSFCTRLVFVEDRHRRIASFLIGFHFAMPLFSTRPMIESLAMPWLTLSAAWGCVYARSGSWRALGLALMWLAFASLLRFQAGVCALALLFVVLYRRQWKDLAFFGALGACLFTLTGVPDLLAGQGFHGQLRQYVSYNVQSSAAHFGAMPFYTFLLLAIALSLPPAFFSRYLGFRWKLEYQPLTTVLLYVAIFLLAHTMVAHKEERFFVPILPLFLFTLVPMARFLGEQGPRWRTTWFLGLNTLLLVLACTNTAQKNVISFALWLEEQPRIRFVDNLDAALVFHPQAFLTRDISWNAISSTTYRDDDCTRVAVVRDGAALPSDWTQRFERVGVFEPDWMERILVKANPKNARRGPLVAYMPKRCSGTRLLLEPPF